MDLAKYLHKEFKLDHLITSKTDPNHDLVGKRVLELGCGQGLPGIVPLLAGAEVHFQARHPGTPSWAISTLCTCMHCLAL